MFLLDTNIVSELRKPKPNQSVLSWFRARADHELYLSAVTLGEIQARVEITREQDPAKADSLDDWANQVADCYNVLDLDAKIFRLWAKLMHKQSDTVYEDAMIAATAMIHNLTVVTRHVRDFKRFEVSFFNPFE